MTRGSVPSRKSGTAVACGIEALLLRRSANRTAGTRAGIPRLHASPLPSAFAKATAGQVRLRQGYGGTSPPSPRLRRDKSAFALATARQVRVRPSYGGTSPPSPRLRRDKSAFAKATAGQ